jgi:hypothetical protein
VIGNYKIQDNELVPINSGEHGTYSDMNAGDGHIDMEIGGMVSRERVSREPTTR